MTGSLKLETKVVESFGDILRWPKELPSDAYILVYMHSELLLNQVPKNLDSKNLYEAWAFDGKKSWHIWKRENKWVCTVYDTTDISEDEFVEREQLLMKRFYKMIGKDTLVIHHLLAFDEDGQAYIAYSCPINLKRKGEIECPDI